MKDKGVGRVECGGLYMTEAEYHALRTLDAECRSTGLFDERRFYEGVKALLGDRTPKPWGLPVTVYVTPDLPSPDPTVTHE